MTSKLSQRMGQHINNVYDSLTKRYGVKTLIYYEMYATLPGAIKREKQIRRWHRAWKYRLIATMVLEWQDLFDPITGAAFFGPSDVERDGKT